MKRILVTFALAAISASAFAQLTPEGVMALLPDLPTQAEMVRFETRTEVDTDELYSLYTDFKAALRAAEKQAQESVDKIMKPKAEKAKDAAMAEKVPGTNVTAAQASKMSDAELEALARKSMANNLASAGISMEDLMAVQSGKMTEDQLAAKVMAQQTGGLTPQDIKAMEKMNDAQKMQYLEARGLTESTQAAAAKNQKIAASNNAKVEVMTKIQHIQSRMNATRMKPMKKLEEAKKFGITLYTRDYASRIAETQAELEALIKTTADGEQTAAEAAYALSVAPQIKALQRKVDGLYNDFYAKYIPVWRNAVTDGLDVYKAELLPIAYELEMAYDEAYEVTGQVDYSMGFMFPFDIAGQYLEFADYINDYDLGINE